MRCQYCGKRLPILRKLTDGEFCSPAHRRSFQEEQERQALSRLLEASQMGANRRAQETRPEAVPVKEAVAGTATKKGKASASIPQQCERFFPLAPLERRGNMRSDGPQILPFQPELFLTDELARRVPQRIQRRLRGAGLSRHYGPEPVAARSATAGTATARYATPPGTPAVGPLASRRMPAKNPRLRSGGRWPVRVAVARSLPETVLQGFGKLSAAPSSALFPALRVTTDWIPPRLLSATRMAEAVPTPLAAARIVWPLRQCEAAILKAGTQRLPEQPPMRLVALASGAPEHAGLRPGDHGELRASAAPNPAVWDLPTVRLTVQPAGLAWRPSLTPEGRLPVSRHLLRLPLKTGASLSAEPAAALAVSPVAWIGSPAAPAPRAEARKSKNNIRGTWLMPLAKLTSVPPAGAPALVALTPEPLGQRKPLPPPGKLAAPTPGALDRLVSMPARYRPEARVMADRGRMLFLAVMAKPTPLGTPLAPPKRKKAEARAVKVTADVLPPFSAANTRAADIAAVAQSPAEWLPYPADEIEIAPRSSKLPVAGPKQNRRMLRWIPTLPLCVEGAGLAQFEPSWQTLHLRTLPPRPALHPDPARTKRRSLVPDALRQTFARTPAGRTWKLAPPDLRWVTIAVPVVIGLAWWSLAPKARPSDEPVAEVVPQMAAAAERPAGPTARAVQNRAVLAKASQPESPAEVVPETVAKPAGFFDSYFGPLEAKIRARAAVEVSDDFRSGLSAWEGDRGWSEGWSYDQAGFVLPASLALLRPTTGLTDYTFEFLGMIENKALSWVFRAKDTRNYYAGKIVVVQGGPLPIIAFVRYRVVNGREEGRKVVTLHESVRAETLYRVKIDVNGNDFTTSVLGKIADTFTDTVHPQGGVGLFSARGEQAKIRWVEVSHQYDSIGRLCAFLAPPRLERQPEERSVAGKKLAPKKRGS